LGRRAIGAFPKKFSSRMAGRHFDYVFAARTVSADRRRRVDGASFDQVVDWR
jgi:hypothetical protein